MKRLKVYNSFLVYEKYRFTDCFEFTLSQLKKLDEIQEVYNQIPRDIIEECVIDLEDIGHRFYKGMLNSFLCKPLNLTSGKANTSTGDAFTYFMTSDFYQTSSNIFEHPSFKASNSELFDSIYFTKTKDEIDQLLSNEYIKNHFYNTIIKEIDYFDMYLQEGFPCVAVCKIPPLKNWTLDSKKVDVISELKQKISSFCDYEMIFVPPMKEPSIVFVDKKYLKKL